MLTTASQFTPRARSVCLHHASNAGPRAVGILATAALQHRHQTRGCHFGNSSRPDNDLRKEVLRRHRLMKKIIMGDSQRDVSGGYGEYTRHTIERMMKSFWKSREGATNGIFLGETALSKQQCHEDKHGVGSGRSAENVANKISRGLMDGEDEINASLNDSAWRRNHRLRRTKDAGLFSNPVEQGEFVIDPITNRKVPKHSNLHDSGDAGVDIPVRTFKDYRSQFSHPDIVPDLESGEVSRKSYLDTEPSAEELERYRQVITDNVDEPEPAVGVSGSTYSKLGHKKHGASQEQKSTQTQQAITDSDMTAWDDGVSESVTSLKQEDLHQYKPLEDDDVSTSKIQDISRDMNKEADYNDLRKYRPDYYQDVIEDTASFAEGNYKEYNTLRQHDKALDSIHDEFNDLQPPSDDQLRAYSYDSSLADDIAKRLEEDKAGQHQSTASETDSKMDGESAHYGLSREQRPEVTLLENYEEDVKPEVLRKYHAYIEEIDPRDFQDSTVEHLRKRYGEAGLKQCTVPRDPKRQEAFDGAFEDPGTEHEGLNNRDSQEWVDPADRRRESTNHLNSEKDLEELAKYKPYYWNEPDGKHPPTEEELSLEDRLADARRYDRPFDWDESQANVELSDKELKDLETESDAHHHYGEPAWWNETSSRHENVGFLGENDTRQYDDCKNDIAPEDFEKELHPDDPQEKSKSMEDLMADVDVLRDVEEFERQKPIEDADIVEFGADKDRIEHLERMALDELHNDGAISSHDDWAPDHEVEPEVIDIEASREFSEHMERPEENTLAARTERVEAEKEPTQHVEPSASKRKLTGNYARDFPEDFEKSWTDTLAAAPTEDAQTDQTNSAVSSQSIEGGFEAPKVSKVEPALDRHFNRTSTDYEDSYSKEPQGLETSYAEEVGAPTQPVVMKQYGGDTKADKAKQKESNSFAPIDAQSSQHIDDEGTGGMVYKILAYDPTMQKVNMAETTSFVCDFASALSPADALLRLSHPSKFFPYFASLEAEGFEIASGSGDVLVFRKVRPTATPKPEASEPVTSESPSPETAQSGAASEHRINPIDMTGRPRIISPASANFASPTGYVAYDNLPENEAKDLPPPPPPRVKYNIDMRREEPVYSGPEYYSRTYDEHGRPRPKKMGVGRRLLIGGVWVAAISYGLGVVSEFFTTGGIDGVGATGF